jgi:hypothetical protein
MARNGPCRATLLIILRLGGLALRYCSSFRFRNHNHVEIHTLYSIHHSPVSTDISLVSVAASTNFLLRRGHASSSQLRDVSYCRRT